MIISVRCHYTTYDVYLDISTDDGTSLPTESRFILFAHHYEQTDRLIDECSMLTGPGGVQSPSSDVVTGLACPPETNPQVACTAARDDPVCVLAQSRAMVVCCRIVCRGNCGTEVSASNGVTIVSWLMVSVYVWTAYPRPSVQPRALPKKTR